MSIVTITRIFSVAMLLAVIQLGQASDEHTDTILTDNRYSSADSRLLGIVDEIGREIYIAEDNQVIPAKRQRLGHGSMGDTEPSSRIAGSMLFHPYESHSLSGGATAVAIGDVTGDGRNDIVAVDSDNDSIYVFAQTPAGTLATHISYSAPITYIGSLSGTVDIADLNNDGLLDVVAGMTDAVGVMYQNPAGSLDSPVLYASGHSSFTNVFRLVAGDFNNDGLADVASIDWGSRSDNVDVFHQSVGGALVRSQGYPVDHGGRDDLSAGDLNGDNLTDVVVMSGQGNGDNLGVLYQNSSGAFDAATYYDLGGNELTSGVGVGDVNKDGRQDIVVSYGGNRPNSFIGVFLQDVRRGFELPFSLPSYDIPQAIVIQDIDLDGRQDLITAHYAWSQLGVYRQGTGGSLKTEELYIVFSAPDNKQGFDVGDLNGDGMPDVAVADFSGVSVLYNAGAPPMQVFVDVYPQRCPNPIMSSEAQSAYVSAAVLGTPTMDVRSIDLRTITMAGLRAASSQRPGKPDDSSQIQFYVEYLDIGRPVGPGGTCACSDPTPDGHDDLLLLFPRTSLEAKVSRLGYYQDPKSGTQVPLSTQNPIQPSDSLHNYDSLTRVVEVELGGFLNGGERIQGFNCLRMRLTDDGSPYTANEPEWGIEDVTSMVNVMFQDQVYPFEDVLLDANGDCALDISDLSLVVTYMFANGPAPVPCQLQE